jgi:DNA polymerase-3 subunit delta
MGQFFLITGNDEFAIKDKTRAIACSLCGDVPEENPSLEIIRGDSDENKPEEIIGELMNCLRTPPFFGGDKTIWLKHYQHFPGSSGSKDKNKKLEDILEPLLAFLDGGLPDDTTLIIDGPNIDRRKSFYKAFTKAGEDFYLKKVDLADKNYKDNQAQKIQQLSQEAGKKIDYNAVNYISEAVGSDSGRLKNEIDKLAAYTAEKDHISIDDCKAICSRSPEALSWAFANSLMEKKLKSSLEIINILSEQLLAERGSSSRPELALLGNAVRSFQELIKVKCAMEELGINGSPDKSYFYRVPETVKENCLDNFLLSLNPFRAYMLCQGAARFSDSELVEAVSGLLEANRKLVSGGGEPRIILEQLVIKITGQ